MYRTPRCSDPGVGEPIPADDGGIDGEGEPLPDEPMPPPAPSLDLSKHFPANTGSVMRLIEVDISNPDDLRIVSNLYINGDLVNARLIDGVARVVLRSLPTGLAFKSPEEFVNWELFEDGGVVDGEETSTSTSATSGASLTPASVATAREPRRTPKAFSTNSST